MRKRSRRRSRLARVFGRHGRQRGRERIDTEVAVVGAGPAGLAVAARLKRCGVSYRLFEREGAVAPAWRRHYRRLHLHTSRGFSGLPFRPMPKRYGRYPAREEVVEYFEDYARSLELAPQLGVDVRKIEAGGSEWRVHTSRDVVRCLAVVVATGVNGVPNLPGWRGLHAFPGTVQHSSEYRDGAPFEGRDVLVVGFGNSGGEIALDLLEHGARPVLAVRSPVNIVPRDILGIPVLALAIPLSRLPAALADALIWPILKAHYPSFARLGLRKAARGPFRQIEEAGRIPLLDIGTVREIRRGRIGVQGDVEEVAGSEVRFADGSRREFDAIVLATGYRPRLPPGVGQPSTLLPSDGGRDLPVEQPYYCGFLVSATGMLREVGLESGSIVADIVRRLRGSA